MSLRQAGISYLYCKQFEMIAIAWRMDPPGTRMKMIRRNPPSRECGSREMRCVLQGLVSWSGQGDRYIRIRHFSVRMGRRRAFRRRISNDRECWIVTKPSTQTIFRFLAAGKRSAGSEEQDKHSPAVQTCSPALQWGERGRTRLRLIQAHGRKARTNMRVDSEEPEAMVAVGIYIRVMRAVQGRLWKCRVTF
jgi:hypothetical protein